MADKREKSFWAQKVAIPRRKIKVARKPLPIIAMSNLTPEKAPQAERKPAEAPYTNLQAGAALAAMRTVVTHLCAECSWEFKGIVRAKYCSNACRQRAKYKRRLEAEQRK